MIDLTYGISRIDNGYVLASEAGIQYFKRLHDLLIYIKGEEAQQAIADEAIDASFVCEQGVEGCKGEHS